MRGFLTLAAGIFTLFAPTLAFSQPKPIYGVNLGNWLVTEPWMFPEKWATMGGNYDDKCQTNCTMSELELARTLGDRTDEVFDEHWSTWFTEADVQHLKELRINTVRIPLGYWLVEPIVEEEEEPYAKGGMHRLREGLGWLKDAEIAVILDHHALPGVAAINQSFAGLRTDKVEFYTPKNYHRALIWTAVMTVFSHVDPTFESVFSIQAINEPIQNAALTPGYGQFQKDFVQTIRAVEDILESTPDLASSGNITETFLKATEAGSCSDAIKPVLVDSAPVLSEMVLRYGGQDMIDGFKQPRNEPLTTNFMDMSWQYGDHPNPADAKDGPQTYDGHLYYGFGGIADPNPESYMTHICNLDRVENATVVQNVPLWFGEWSISTNFNATDEFLKQWADAQKLMYSKSDGWIFWNFKLEDLPNAKNYQRQWSYFKGVELGYFTKNPAKYHNRKVCDKYKKRQART